MDVAWILLVLTVAGANFGQGLADGAPQSSLGPLRHTARFAGQDDWSWSGSTASPPAAGSSSDRYAQLPQQPTISRSSVGPPPSISERAQNAFTETGSTLRDGVEATVRAANQQLSRGGEQMFDNTRDAGTQFGQQFQDWSGTAGQQLQSAGNNIRTAAGQVLGTSGSPATSSNPFVSTTTPQPTNTKARSSVAPPPWPTSSTPSSQPWPDSTTPLGSDNRTTTTGNSMTPTGGGWTSIGSTIAAPPLLIPQLPTTTNNVARAGAATGRSGPNFPVSSSAERPPNHSLLAAPARQTTPTANPADDWASGWDINSPQPQATIGRTGSTPSLGSTVRDSDLVPLQPVVTNATPQDAKKSTGARTDDFWGDTDTWTKSPQAPPSAQATSAAGANPASNTSANNSPPTNLPAISPAPSNLNLAGPALSATQAGNGTGVVGPKQAGALATGEQPPWVPLLVVSLSLAGSLAANLFLGFSYVDARQKYQSLVRKTADTFRRTTTAAA